jgi:DNA modification methylase
LAEIGSSMTNYQKKLVDFLDFKDKYEIMYLNLKPEEITFKGKLIEPVHSWFRLTPSYSPYLVRLMINYLRLNKEKKVLEPFTGTGTTLIECKKAGIESYGVEINPILYSIAKGAINWDLNTDLLNDIISLYIKGITENIEKNKEILIESFPSKLNIEIPKIHDVFRWWRPEILKDLLICKENMKKLDVSEDYRHFIRVGLSSILLDVANIIHGHPTICFLDNPAYKKKHPEKQDRTFEKPLVVLKEKLRIMLKDLKLMQKIENFGKSHLQLGDSKYLSKIFRDQKFDAVITSPPYPNRYSYVMETRPYLFFFDEFNDAKESASLDLESIGGTWGRATFTLKDIIINPIDNCVDNTVGAFIERIRKVSNLMANYELKYFNNMYEHFKEVFMVMNNSGKLAYVIGNSRIKGVEIPSDVILADLMVCCGFQINKIIRSRTRLGKRNLYEAIIYAQKPA